MSDLTKFVIPAKAGISGDYNIPLFVDAPDPSLRWGDKGEAAE